MSPVRLTGPEVPPEPYWQWFTAISLVSADSYFSEASSFLILSGFSNSYPQLSLPRPVFLIYRPRAQRPVKHGYRPLIRGLFSSAVRSTGRGGPRPVPNASPLTQIPPKTVRMKKVVSQRVRLARVFPTKRGAFLLPRGNRLLPMGRNSPTERAALGPYRLSACRSPTEWATGARSDWKGSRSGDR